ncbi:L2 minor capsid protein [Bos taurus papillomavirus 42]|nr:L2 minor capsid protein [Bos taurus papillomavirus 42]
MVRAARRKRASEDDLYRGCRMGQDCPIDIKNKYEQNTLADRILKWVSSFLYFGTLGISSGKGTGGPTGYTPLGSGGGAGGVRPGKGANVARPTVILDALGPAGVPIDPAVPDTSIVPLLEESGGSTTLDVTPGAEIEIVAEVHPPPTVGAPEITIGEPDDPPILDVTPETHPTSRIRSTSSKHDNPAFTAYVASTQLPGETSAADHVYVLHGFNGEFVGPADPEGDAIFEEIPLEEFGVPESPPSTSTPNTSFRQVLNKFQRRLYNRRLVQQVKITDRNTFLKQPSQFVRWEFDNPTFDDESVSLIFQQDVNEISAAPVSEFQDLVKLSRPIFSDTEGLVRVSRLGQRGTIRTRSGLQIGGHVHYYTDISPIRALEDIEMSTFGEVSGDSIIMQPLGESTFVDAGAMSETLNEGIIEFPENVLDDDYNEDFSHARLEITTSARSRTSIITVQDGIPPGSVKMFINDAEATVTPHYTPSPDSPGKEPYVPIQPADIPDIIINFGEGSATFFLHPSLLKKHKHKRWFF